MPAWIIGVSKLRLQATVYCRAIGCVHLLPRAGQAVLNTPLAHLVWPTHQDRLDSASACQTAELVT